jgi:hypothetical protein
MLLMIYNSNSNKMNCYIRENIRKRKCLHNETLLDSKFKDDKLDFASLIFHLEYLNSSISFYFVFDTIEIL